MTSERKENKRDEDYVAPDDEPTGPEVIGLSDLPYRGGALMSKRPGASSMDCGCGPGWRRPKPNGTCATCGGWLPGERPAPLPWTQAALEVTDDQ